MAANYSFLLVELLRPGLGYRGVMVAVLTCMVVAGKAKETKAKVELKQ